jgi:hypothetical protein
MNRAYYGRNSRRPNCENTLHEDCGTNSHTLPCYLRIVTLINIVTHFISQHIVLLFDPAGYFSAVSRDPPTVPQAPYSATTPTPQHHFRPPRLSLPPFNRQGRRGRFRFNRVYSLGENRFPGHSAGETDFSLSSDSDSDYWNPRSNHPNQVRISRVSELCDRNTPEPTPFYFLGVTEPNRLRNRNIIPFDNHRRSPDLRHSSDPSSESDSDSDEYPSHYRLDAIRRVHQRVAQNRLCSIGPARRPLPRQ